MRISKLLLSFILLLLVTPLLGQEQEMEEVPDDVMEDVVDEEYYNEEEDYGAKPYFSAFDSSRIESRFFDSTKLANLKQDDNFNYGYTRSTTTAWEELGKWISRLFQHTDYPGIISYKLLIYVVLILLLSFAIIKLMKLETGKIFFSSKNKSNNDPLVIEENIHEMDFEKLIRDALAKNDLRLAIRLFFLYGLKMLSDSQHIYWEPGKTNHEYLNELQHQELKNGLSRLNYYFEHTWYGNFTVNKEMFSTVQSLFTSWKNKIN